MKASLIGLFILVLAAPISAQSAGKLCFSPETFNAAIAAGLHHAQAEKRAMLPCPKDSGNAEILNVNVIAYDCSVGTVSRTRGKCRIIAEVDGKEVRLTASPEVAAPWGNSYGNSNCRPMSNLGLLVSKKGEIITVRDSKGEKVTTKFDYSR